MISKVEERENLILETAEVCGVTIDDKAMAEAYREARSRVMPGYKGTVDEHVAVQRQQEDIARQELRKLQGE